MGRGTFARRLALWKGSIQPGYSGGQGAYFVELLEFVGGEFEVYGGEVVVELVEALGSDDDGGDEGLGEDVGEGYGGG